jgi:hypothetical protein
MHHRFTQNCSDTEGARSRGWYTPDIGLVKLLSALCQSRLLTVTTTLKLQERNVMALLV